MFGLEKLFGKSQNTAVETAEKSPVGIGYEIRDGKFVWWFKFDDGSAGEKEVEEDFPLAKTTEENEANIKSFESDKLAQYEALKGEEE
ncbi:MAG: hypothetical protein WC631_03725 [Candidatus Paceibacterota bacterium]|jgi:hypothetical protein